MQVATTRGFVLKGTILNFCLRGARMNMIQTRFSKSMLSLLFACTTIFIFTGYAQAATVSFDFPLSASQQVPPSGSAGTGSCNVMLDDVSGAVSVSCMFSGLSATASVSHIHGLAAVGINAGVILTLTPDLATSGNITGNGILDAAQMTGMLGGMTYVNLHSQQFPGGELRGQIVDDSGTGGGSIPLPTMSNIMLMVMIALLLVVGGVTLRKRSL